MRGSRCQRRVNGASTPTQNRPYSGSGPTGTIWTVVGLAVFRAISILPVAAASYQSRASPTVTFVAENAQLQPWVCGTGQGLLPAVHPSGMSMSNGYSSTQANNKYCSPSARSVASSNYCSLVVVNQLLAKSSRVGRHSVTIALPAQANYGKRLNVQVIAGLRRYRIVRCARNGGRSAPNVEFPQRVETGPTDWVFALGTTERPYA